MPMPRVHDIDPQRRAAAASSEHDAARARVAQRVREEVAQDALEKHGIGIDAPACGHHAQCETASGRLGPEVGGETGEQRRKRDLATVGLHRAGVEPGQVEQLPEQRFERLDRSVDACRERLHLGVARLRRKGGGEETHGMQRLAQVVARGGEELALRAIGGFSGGARGLGLALAGGETLDQVDVLVADRERLRQHVVQLAAERQDEYEDDEQHEGGEDVDLSALERDARDQRDERGQREPVERRLVDRGQVEAAQDDAEDAHDQERLMRRRRREHGDGGDAPQRAGDRRARGPVATPARRLRHAGARATIRAGEDAPPCLVRENCGEPERHHRRVLAIPQHEAEDCGAERHRRRGAMP